MYEAGFQAYRICECSTIYESDERCTLRNNEIHQENEGRAVEIHT